MRRLVLLLGLAAALASAQDRGTEVFAPFVSRLKARAGDSRVLLTWRNPADTGGARLVYRSTEEITASTLAAASLVARLDGKSERFEDAPPNAAPYYYAVLVEGPEGKLYDMLIPFRNKTSQAVRISAAAPEQDLATRVTDLRAQVVGDSVHLVFRSSRPERPLLLFRGTFPISVDEHLLAADAPVALDAGVQEYRDYPIPGVDAYYAVIDAGLFKVGQSRISPGQNATQTPVQVPTSVPRVALPPAAAPARTSRSLPLPYLGLPGQAAPQRSADLVVPDKLVPLQPATRTVLERLLAACPAGQQPPRRSVQILPADLEEFQSGETRNLQQILRQLLQKGRHAQAEAALRGLLLIHRSESAEARVHFYLGQSLYMQELYQDAALEFLLAREQLYAHAQPWLEDSLRLLAAQVQS